MKADGRRELRHGSPTDTDVGPRRPSVTSAAERVVKLLSDKWTVPIFRMLRPGTKRHAELRRGMSGVSHRMLTRTLRSLERHGLVTRRVHPQVPPKVEYSLTSLGRSLNRAMGAVCRWAERYGPELDRTATLV